MARTRTWKRGYARCLLLVQQSTCIVRWDPDASNLPMKLVYVTSYVYLDKVTLDKTFFELQSSQGSNSANGASIE